MSALTLTAAVATRKLAVYYEHPRWFEPLFAEMDRREMPYARLRSDGHGYDPADLAADPAVAVVLNRMSPSAHNRGHGDAILYTLNYLSHLELSGKRVINGERAYLIEISKARQLSLLARLGLRAPRSRVIHRAADAPAAAEGLRFPVVVKPNVGGSGVGIVRFDAPAQLATAAAGGLDLGLDGVALVQEFIPARGGHIVRVECLGGRFLYAIQVHLAGATFDLCPADLCRTPKPLDSACPAEAPRTGLRVDGYRPPESVIAAVERIQNAAGISVGGVEYVVDDRDGEVYYYDINALSNFVADAPRVIGFDPFPRLVDWLQDEIARA